MGMENINGQMEDYIVDSGKIIKWMDLAHIYGPMELYTLEM